MYLHELRCSSGEISIQLKHTRDVSYQIIKYSYCSSKYAHQGHHLSNALMLCSVYLSSMGPISHFISRPMGAAIFLLPTHFLPPMVHNTMSPLWNHSWFVHWWSWTAGLMSLKISLKAYSPVTMLQAEYILPLLPHCPLHFLLKLRGSRFNFCIDLVQKRVKKSDQRSTKSFPLNQSKYMNMLLGP